MAADRQMIASKPMTIMRVASEGVYRPSARYFAMLSLIGGVWFVLAVLALHLLPTGYDPIRQVVSDYAVGPYGLVMDLGFAAAGIGSAALAAGLSRLRDSGRAHKAGTILLFVAGIGTFVLGFFPIDLPGAALTTHGIFHSLVSLFVFISQPVGILLLSRGFGRREFWVSLLAFIVVALAFLLNGAFPIDASGLSERVFLTMIVSWSLLASIHVFRHSS